MDIAFFYRNHGLLIFLKHVSWIWYPAARRLGGNSLVMEWNGMNRSEVSDFSYKMEIFWRILYGHTKICIPWGTEIVGHKIVNIKRSMLKVESRPKNSTDSGNKSVRESKPIWSKSEGILKVRSGERKKT
jgi:hypothetical protein